MSKLDFTPEEFDDRLARTRKAIAEHELDWMILFHPVSILWLTGSEAKSYQAFQCLLVSAGTAPLTMIVRESERAEITDDTRVQRLHTWGGSEPGDPLELFSRVCTDLGLTNSRVGIEVPPYYLHPHHYLQIRDILGAALVGEPSNLVANLKLVKSQAEIGYVREAARLADIAAADFGEALVSGASELELAGEVYRSLLANGSGLAASTLNLVSGERSCFSHGAPTQRRLGKGDFGNIEFGAAYRRYTSTIGRQFVCGEPSSRQQELYDLVLAATEACIGEMRDGVAATTPHQAAKRVIAEAGLDRYRIHTSGYGLAPGFPPSWGEPVNMFAGNEYTLRAGMVLSVEPPIFIQEEKLGARLIDNVLITETGVEVLTKFPRDLMVFD